MIRLFAATVGIFRLFGSFVILLLAVHTAAVESLQPLRYSVDGPKAWVPYFAASNDKPGIIPELIELVLADTDLPRQRISLGPLDHEQALLDGRLHVDVTSPSWYPDSQVPAPFVLSEPLLALSEYVYAGKCPGTDPADLTQLQGQQVGTITGYLYHDADQYQRHDFESEEQLVLALDKCEVSIGILGQLPAQYWSHQHNILLFQGRLHSRGYLGLRTLATRKQLLKPINESIHRLQSQGAFDQVLQNYQVLPKAP